MEEISGVEDDCSSDDYSVDDSDQFGDTNKALEITEPGDDRWMWEHIHTEAKPRKKISRKKSKARRKQQRLEWQEIVGAVDLTYIQNLIDIGLDPFSDPHLRVPGAYERPVPRLKDICVGVIYKNCPNTLTRLPYRIRMLMGALVHPMQDHLEGCLVHFFDNLESVESTLTNYNAPSLQRLRLGKRSVVDGFDSESVSRVTYEPSLFENCDNLLTSRVATRSLQQGHHHIYHGGILVDHLARVASFAGYLNFLLPSFITDHKKFAKKGVSVDNYEKQCMRLAVEKVYDYLKNRVPVLCKHFFTLLIPFVWWARGHRLMTEEYFKEAICKAKSDEISALLYNELGRMYVHFGDVHLAPQCFLKAADISKQCQDGDVQRLIDLQANMLIASAFDQGVMSEKSWHHAMSAWDVALKNPDAFAIAEHSAFLSLMCFHLTCTLSLYKSQLVEKARKHPLLFLGLSLTEAMMGNVSLTTDFYQLFLTRFDEKYPDVYRGVFPGATVQNVPPHFHPWIKVTMAVDDSSPVKPLPILWRRLLTHPILKQDYHGTGAGDITRKDATLWMTPDGFISGDFQLLLPPVPHTKLDPYTGTLCFMQGCVPPGPWKSCVLPSLKYESHDYHMPTQIRLFDNSSVAVDLYLAYRVIPHPINIESYCTAEMQLIWTCQEQEVIIDLKKEIKRFMKNSLIELQHTMDGPWPYNREEYLKIVEMSCQRGYSLQSKYVTSLFKRLGDMKHRAESSPCVLNAKSESKRKKLIKKETKRMYKQEYNWNSQLFHMCLQSYTIVGSSLVLFLGPLRSASEGSFMYIFDCTSAATFKDWKMHDLGEYTDKLVPFVVVPSGDGIHYPHASVFMVQRRKDFPPSERRKKQRSLKWFDTYDKKGNLLACLMADPMSPERVYLKFEYVIGHTKYGMNYQTGRLVGEDVLEDKCIQSRRFRSVTSIHSLGKWLLVATEFGIYVTNQQLEPLRWNFRNDGCSLELADNECRVQGALEGINVLINSIQHGTEDQPCRVIISFEDTAILFYLHDGKSWDETLQGSVAVQVPGVVNDACFIDKNYGFLVVASISDVRSAFYQENVYQFTPEGRMIGILPFLGFGPHRFLPVDYPGNEEAAAAKENPLLGESGCFIYCFDGYGAVCCFKPVKSDE